MIKIIMDDKYLNFKKKLKNKSKNTGVSLKKTKYLKLENYNAKC